MRFVKNPTVDFDDIVLLVSKCRAYLWSLPDDIRIMQVGLTDRFQVHKWPADQWNVWKLTGFHELDESIRD